MHTQPMPHEPAGTFQATLKETHPDFRTPTWRLVCWRSSAIVIGGRLVEALAWLPDNKEEGEVEAADSTFHEFWRNPSTYAQEPDKICDEVLRRLLDVRF